MNVSLTSEFEQFVDAKVKSGDFSTASEVVRAGLRLLKEQDAEHQARLTALRQAVGIGLEQSRLGHTKDGDEVLAGIRGRRKQALRTGGK